VPAVSPRSYFSHTLIFSNFQWLLILGLTAGVVYLAFRLMRHRGSHGKLVRSESTIEQAVEIEAPDEQLFHILQIEPQRNAQPLEVPARVRTSLESVLQRSPAIFQTGKEMADRSFRVIFSSEVTQSLSSGEAKLVRDRSIRAFYLAAGHNASTLGRP